jgi:hypothetical protein
MRFFTVIMDVSMNTSISIRLEVLQMNKESKKEQITQNRQRFVMQIPPSPETTTRAEYMYVIRDHVGDFRDYQTYKEERWTILIGSKNTEQGTGKAGVC